MHFSGDDKDGDGKNKAYLFSGFESGKKKRPNKLVGITSILLEFRSLKAAQELLSYYSSGDDKDGDEKNKAFLFTVVEYGKTTVSITPTLF